MIQAIRKSKVFDNPLTVTELTSFKGQPLNTSLLNVFDLGESRRKGDILNVMRYNSFTKAYESKQ